MRGVWHERRRAVQWPVCRWMEGRRPASAESSEKNVTNEKNDSLRTSARHWLALAHTDAPRRAYTSQPRGSAARQRRYAPRRREAREAREAERALCAVCVATHAHTAQSEQARQQHMRGSIVSLTDDTVSRSERVHCTHN